MTISPFTFVWDGSRFAQHSIDNSDKTKTIIEVTDSGVCGSDFHLIEHPTLAIGRSLGHEILGKIVTCGNHQKSIAGEVLKPGDRVVVVPGAECGLCPHCLTHPEHTHLCKCRVVHGFGLYSATTSYPVGGFSSHISLDARIWVAKVPPTIPDSVAVLTELVAVAMRGIERALSVDWTASIGPSLGCEVLVIGAGPLGVCSALIAHSLGFKVTCIDTNPWRVNYCQSNFPFRTTEISADESEQITVQKEAFNLVFQCAGSPVCFGYALDAVCPGGTIVELGHFVPSEERVLIDPGLIVRKDLRIVGSVLAPPSIYQKVIRFMEWKVDLLSKVVTAQVSMTDINDILDLMAERNFIKLSLKNWPFGT